MILFQIVLCIFASKYFKMKYLFTVLFLLIFSVGFKTQALRFAYSYDMNVGKKATMPLGSHEVTLTLLFEKKTKKKYKAIGCPSFLE